MENKSAEHYLTPRKRSKITAKQNEQRRIFFFKAIIFIATRDLTQKELVLSHIFWLWSRFDPWGSVFFFLPVCKNSHELTPVYFSFSFTPMKNDLHQTFTHNLEEACLNSAGAKQMISPAESRIPPALYQPRSINTNTQNTRLPWNTVCVWVFLYIHAYYPPLCNPAAESSLPS